MLWGRERPELQEVGPFVYNIIATKYDVHFGTMAATNAPSTPYVSYKVHTQLQFDGE